jgi:pseudo-rSAM protein
LNKQNVSKSYWFHIETYVHVSLKRNNLLLYNTYTGRTLEYDGEAHGKILRLIRRLQSPKNLWMVRLREEELRDPEISGFVEKVRQEFMGDLTDTALSEGKPAQMVPIVTIQRRVERLKKEAHRSVGEGMMQYLTEVSIHVNSRCPQQCHLCCNAYRQFSHCTTEKSGPKSDNGELNIEKIRNLFSQLEACSLVNINILGGDVFGYSQLEALVENLDRHPAPRTVFTHYKNVSQREKQLALLNPEVTRVKVMIPFPIDWEHLKAAVDTLNRTGHTAFCMFIVKGEEELAAAEQAVESLQIENPGIQPYYDGANLEFFRECVFSQREDILEAKPQLKDIYMNSEVNEIDFGRIIVYSNGGLYANANGERLGILGKNSLYDVLYKEMYHGKSWRRTRKRIEPCKSCTFELLCPPLTNYSRAIGRNDLCFKYELNERKQ